MRNLFLVLLMGLLLAACSGTSRTTAPGTITETTGVGTGDTGTTAATSTVSTSDPIPSVDPDAIPQQTEQMRADLAIKEAVMKQLNDEGFQQIEVETQDGVVTLSGTIPKDQFDRLMKVAQSVPQVQSVNSNLTVQ